MPVTIQIESYNEFLARHSGTPLQLDGKPVSTGPLRSGGELLFADGGSCSADDGDLREEPPRSPVENLRARLRYWRAAVERSESDFAHLRDEAARAAELALRYNNLPGASFAQIEGLRVLRAMVAHARNEVAGIEKQLAEKTVDDPASQRRRFAEEYERREQARAAEVLHEIASINV